MKKQPGWVRRIGRPVAFRLRHLARSLHDTIASPQSWRGNHHPVLAKFEPWEGRADGTFVYDFLGVRTDYRFRPQLKPQPRGPLKTSYPAPYASYFELVFVLESVAAARSRDRFTVIELGAGYGPWLAIAHRAMQAIAPKPVHLVGVEMVAQHYKWMHDHLRNNGINPEDHTLIEAAVSSRSGQRVYRPEPNREWDFGQTLLPRTQHGQPPTDGVEVRCVTLPEILQHHEHVDVIHADLQGEELNALGPALAELDDKVSRLIVATHSRSIHRSLRRSLANLGWTCVYDFGLRRRERTAFGDVRFLDGLLAFVNPKFG